jgi:hypothetical protein
MQRGAAGENGFFPFKEQRLSQEKILFTFSQKSCWSIVMAPLEAYCLPQSNFHQQMRIRRSDTSGSRIVQMRKSFFIFFSRSEQLEMFSILSFESTCALCGARK